MNATTTTEPNGQYHPLTSSDLAGMSEDTRRSLARYAEILDNDRGCTTPAEELITTLVLTHLAGGLTPEDADRCVEDFRESFDMAIRAAQRITRQYPEHVAGTERG